MPTPIPFDAIQFSPTAWLFQGDAHAPGLGADFSAFIVTTPPGKGVGQHVHPYVEVFVLLEGSPTFLVDGEEIAVTPGHVVAVPAGTPHGFTNTGDVPLQMVSIHGGGTMQQRFLDAD